MGRFELNLGPVGIAGSGITGIGGAILVLIIVLTWLTMAPPPFVLYEQALDQDDDQ